MPRQKLQARPTVRTAKRNYARAVASRAYDIHTGGLSGKHDNVRVFWEDPTRRRLLRRHLVALQQDLGRRRLRVVDLGCGAGQGYELLTSIERQPNSVSLHHDFVLGDGDIDFTGVDLSEEMIDKARESYAGRDNIRFDVGDLNEGLGALRRQPSFDLYYSSYGSFSHLSATGLRRLLRDIAAHAQPGALVVLDLVGRLSVEWPGYWNAATEAEKVRDYTMNYLYLGDRAAMDTAEHFPIRFWTGDEVRRLARSCRMDVVEQTDCSILVGRHVDTRQYNPAAGAWRRAVNSLHQDFRRTDLRTLRVDQRVAGRHPVATPVLQRLITSWNTLVDFTRRRLEGPVSVMDLPGWETFRSPLQFALMAMDRVVADAQWMHYGDPRANFIEPQLGYMLRSLELGLQEGAGTGHAHLALLRIRTPKPA